MTQKKYLHVFNEKLLEDFYIFVVKKFLSKMLTKESYVELKKKNDNVLKETFEDSVRYFFRGNSKLTRLITIDDWIIFVRQLSDEQFKYFCGLNQTAKNYFENVELKEIIDGYSKI